MMSPVEAEAMTWSVVPVIESTAPEPPPVAVKVIDPPNETSPPPESPEPALIVIEELLNAEFGMLVKVFEDPEMLLLVRVWTALSITKLPFEVSAGTETVKAPDPPVCVEIIVLASVSWFDPDVKLSVLPERDPAVSEANVTGEVVSSG